MGQLADTLARTIQTLENLEDEKWQFMAGYKDAKKPLVERISKYAKAIKAGCETAQDYNLFAEGDWNGPAKESL